MFSNADLWCLANMISYIFFSYELHNIKRNSKRTKSMTRDARVSFGLVQIRRFTENGQLENGETLPVFFFFNLQLSSFGEFVVWSSAFVAYPPQSYVF